MVFVSLTTGICVMGMTLVLRGWYGRFVDRIEADLRRRLRGLRASPENLRRWIQSWMALVAATFFAGWLLLDSFVFGTLATLAIAVGPWYAVRSAARRRREKIERQMADALATFSAATRAGLSISQALSLLADECPRPIRQEFQQIAGQYQLGKSLEQSLGEAKTRLRSENFLLFSAALLASRESGGKLNDTVDRIAKSVVELERLERKIDSETAQARKSAVYMAIVPAVLLGVYWIIDPVNTRLLFVTLPGQMLLGTSLILNVAAYLWAVYLLNPEI